MRIRELVKTYRLINDPDAPSWSVKFVGALVIVAGVAGVALLAWYASDPGQEGGPAAVAQSVGGASPGAHTEFVPLEKVPEWRQSHPRAEVLSSAPVTQDGAITGYEMTYR